MASTVEGRSVLRASIVVPVLDEQDAIVGLLDHLAAHFPSCEVVVADGGSRDATVERATGRARVVIAAPGRGPQLNAGAAAAGGEVLWFVHVDTRPDPSALAEIHRALADPSVVGGGCRIRFDRGGPALAWLRMTSNLRARHLHWIFGDQAMFVRRAVFEHVGGFPELPIMEDLEMSRRLARQGRLVLLRAWCTASARRFVDQGTLRMIVVMQYLKALYFLGVAPERIAGRYARARRPATARRRPLAVIADLERRTRPVDPRFVAALARRWGELPRSPAPPVRCSDATGWAARAPTGCSRATTWRAPPATTRAGPIGCGSTGSTPWRRSRPRCGCCTSGGVRGPTPSSSAARSPCSTRTTTPPRWTRCSGGAVSR